MHDNLVGPWVTTFSSSLPGSAGDVTTMRASRRTMTAGRTRVRGMRAGPRRTPIHTPREAPVRGVRRVSGAAAPPAMDARLLGPVLFKSALVRERKRADRFSETFALVTIRFEPWAARAVVAAIAAGIRDTDFFGWLDEGSVIGVILTDIRDSPLTAARLAESRVRHELAARIDESTAARLQVSRYVHPGPGVQGIDGADDVNALIDDLWPAGPGVTYLVLKRTLDIVGSAVLMALLSPLFLVLGVLVKWTSPGPMLFRQQRIGHLARPFTMLKFRTMMVGNDPTVHRQFVDQYISGTHAALPKDGAPFKIKNDPRVTPIGRLLRRTSLDELPQLWNVFTGEMSLVGPRPPLSYELERYRSWHWGRVLEAKPGVTGLWQVRGRSRTTFDEMVRMDLTYARTRSLWMDIRILLATPRAVITGKGAY